MPNARRLWLCRWFGLHDWKTKRWGRFPDRRDIRWCKRCGIVRP